ncbi:hypothetical protein ACIRYZ_27525 [Kitasatospora sp. NPDC101155]|uniref:hypothetical protein n=1 Tax=Kitasatospora sp. NPDC101155 TaxID=3364097 RepID=UPI00381D946A
MCFVEEWKGLAMRGCSLRALRVGVVSAALGGVLVSAVPAVAVPTGRIAVDTAARAEALSAPGHDVAAAPAGDTGGSASNASGAPSAAAVVRAAEDAYYSVSRAADIAHWAAVDRAYSWDYGYYFGNFGDGYYADDVYFAVARAERVAHRAAVVAAAHAGSTGYACAPGKSVC